jgi:type IX secretion system PorP/SprF family membrane protein
MKKLKIQIRAAGMALAAVLVPAASEAQFDAMFTQYMFNETFINPAYAGSKEAMSATLLHRQQWVSFPGRPVTTTFALHGPLMDNKMGLGLSVLSEKVGVMTRNLIYASYAYRLKIHEGGTLAMGLMGGIDNQVNRFSSVRLSDEAGAPQDRHFSQNSPNVLASNFGTGLYYNTKSFFAGLSVPRLLDNEVKLSYDGARTVKITRLDPSKFTYYLTLGNVFRISDDLKLRGTAMVKAVSNAPAQLDLTASAFINEMIWAGLGYRSNSSMSAILGLQVNKQLLVSYSYDYGLNKIQKYSLGSHEIALNYLFSFKGRQIVTPRYF